MCGIAGFWGKYSHEETRRIARSLSQCLAHRGRDGQGVYTDGDISLVHTRLSIIDLSENGDQPLYNEDKSIALVCNGEIYNYKELRAGLLKKGHVFHSDSDSEIILHLYEEHKNSPADLLNLLTGMFAFALWDSNKKKLLVARDRIGIKPLYYSKQGERFIFSSEVKPISVSGINNFSIDHTSLFEYFLTGVIPGPNTLYNEIKALEPGHFLTLDASGLRITGYWDIPHSGRRWKQESDLLDEADNLLTEIIRDHLIADVPVGSFLSAGVDSSLITAIAAAHHPGIHTFTASFPGEPEDEGEIASDTAWKLDTTHHSYELQTDFFKDFSKQFGDMDQPFAVSSALSLGRISEMAAKTVKVVLSGDGGDELFGGYARHRPPVRPGFLKFIPGPMQNAVLHTGAKVTGKKSLSTLAENLALPEGRVLLNRMAVTHEQEALSLLSPEVSRTVDTERYLRRLNKFFADRDDKDTLNRTLYVDMKTTLVDEMLTKCDRMTMINGLEGRVPFLDHRLVELAFSIPAAYKRDGETGKLILRKLLAKRLGAQLAFREKTGFNAPLKQWLEADAATKHYVQNAISKTSGLEFLNKDLIIGHKDAAHEYAPGLVFSLVCLNQYFAS